MKKTAFAADLEDEIRTTEFSSCRKYRYHLTQVWDNSKSNLIWLLLNPSTADEVKNDPTVERCEKRARMWGFGGVEVFNIFAYRATDPQDMRNASDPVGPDNDYWMRNFALKSRDTTAVVAWGDHGKYMNRGEHVLELLKEHKAKFKALKINSSGHPSHPLYLSYKLKPVSFKPK